MTVDKTKQLAIFEVMCGAYFCESYKLLAVNFIKKMTFVSITCKWNSCGSVTLHHQVSGVQVYLSLHAMICPDTNELIILNSASYRFLLFANREIF